MLNVLTCIITYHIISYYSPSTCQTKTNRKCRRKQCCDSFSTFHCSNSSEF